MHVQRPPEPWVGSVHSVVDSQMALVPIAAQRRTQIPESGPDPGKHLLSVADHVHRPPDPGVSGVHSVLEPQMESLSLMSEQRCRQRAMSSAS